MFIHSLSFNIKNVTFYYRLGLSGLLSWVWFIHFYVVVCVLCLSQLDSSFVTRIQEPVKKYDRKERKTKFIYFKNKKSSSVLCHFIIDMNQFYGYEYTWTHINLCYFSEIICKTLSFWTNFTKHRFWSHRNCSIGSTLALKAKHTQIMLKHTHTHIHIKRRES